MAIAAQFESLSMLSFYSQNDVLLEQRAAFSHTWDAICIAYRREIR